MIASRHLVLAMFTLRAACADTCADSAFKGFDSRLTAKAIARMGDLSEKASGFEVFNGNPVIAFPHKLLAVRDGSMKAIASIEPVQAIARDDSGHIWLQTRKDVRRVTPQRVEIDQPMSQAVRGRLFGSDRNTLLDVVESPNETDFLLTTVKGHVLPVFRTTGKCRTASWNSEGLAAVVGDRLIAWQTGAPQIMQLARDSGLEHARDVVLVGPGRAVVSLEHVTLLIAPDTTLVLIDVPTRCRWVNNTLFLFDEDTGLIWSVQGLESIGSAGADYGYARSIVSKLPPGTPESSPAFLEAARLVGCGQARAWLPSRK
jgi:hypothetical protein